MVVSQETEERIAKETKRVVDAETWRSWKASDADLISQYSKNFADFKSKMGDHIQWHIKVIGADEPLMFNEQYQTKMGVNVKERSLAPDLNL